MSKVEIWKDIKGYYQISLGRNGEDSAKLKTSLFSPIGIIKHGKTWKHVRI